MSDVIELFAPLYDLTAFRQSYHPIQFILENIESITKAKGDSVPQLDSRTRSLATVCSLQTLQKSQSVRYSTSATRTVSNE